jgi:RimJ/RimL family protein N-acetyltransferase
MITDCTHTLSYEPLLRSGISATLSQETASIESQFESQLGVKTVLCPTCASRVHKISLNAFPYPVINIAPLPSGLAFKQIFLDNIENQGLYSNDSGDTYRRMAVIANDFFHLTKMFGPVIGRLLYYMPTAWKANLYIENMKKNPGWAWLIINPDSETVGILNLSKVDPDRFALDDTLRAKNLYHIGLSLRTPFQGKGILTHLVSTLFDQLPKLQLPIDGICMATRPDNLPINRLAQKLNFALIKTHNTPLFPVLPFWTCSLNLNFYAKLFIE